MKPNERDYIFIGNVDYANTSDNSVWGKEDKAVNSILQSPIITGRWLNLCAGDGRFNSRLLKYADHVIAIDIDETALQKLIRITPKKLIHKLSTEIINITEPLPFENNVFDGVFCVGTLHYFPKPILLKIFKEMKRVVKHEGEIIIDFATDIKRIRPDESLWTFKNEPNYTLNEALSFLNKVFKNSQYNVIIDKVEPEKVKLDAREYIFSSNLIIIKAINKHSY